ncbi:MAG: TIGR02099 family protein [Methylibium sp.]|uniref:YhdP family phospholipid transporter n=1 Tax=Methylibium sp. TaxID=2067992 RepID=UPI0018597AFC|nr:AsmA-like C-terminal region-containing protein [Methylibium sp.]MBA2721514.1 TIGR02099 family protein [Methylibium sp.]MBA3596668.1 TIGR02099 family protein [Methylibium sp.]
MLTIPPSPRARRDASPGTQRVSRAGWLTALRWLAAALLFLCSLVVAAWLILQWGILPRIEHWRPLLEARASEALGVPVRIGVISVTHDEGGLRWARAIELRDVVLNEPAGTGAAPTPAPSAGPTELQPSASAAVREALHLPRVRIALSPTSLLPGWDGHWRLRFTQLRIEGARLELRRDAQGRIRLAGLPPQGEGGGDGRAEDWFFSQPDFILEDATLTWFDEQRAAVPVVLSDVDLTVRNGARRHVLSLKATPPPDWGARFTLQGDFTQPLLAGTGGGSSGVLARPGDWRQWRGTLQAGFAAIDLAALRPHAELPFGLESGRGALSTELDVRQARVLGARTELGLRDVVLRPDLQGQAQGQPLVFSEMSGRLGGRLDRTVDGQPTGGEIAAERFGFTTADGEVWPAGDARLRWRSGADGAVAGGELRADRIDLALLHQTLARLPPGWLDDPLRERLSSLDPGGVASDVQASWDGALHAPARYRLQAQLAGLRLAAEAAAASIEPSAAAASGAVVLGRPGVYGADVELQATEAGGSARIALRGGALEFPGVFAQPRVELDELSAALSWRIDSGPAGGAPQLELRARDVRFANADAQGEFDATWSTSGPSAPPATAAVPAHAAAASAAAAAGSGRLPGVLDLQGRLSRAQATRVARYLPLHIPVRVRRYVEQAVQGGRATAVDFKLRGDLRDFPFAAGARAQAANGEFRVAAQLQGMRLAVLPDETADAGGAAGSAAANARAWPVFSEVQGELVLERRAMVLRGLQGRLASVGSGALRVRGVQGGIADWDRQATLRLEGQSSGPLADALAFVNSTPVGGWIGDALAQTSTGGVNQAPLALQLALNIPLQGDAAGRQTGDEVAKGAASGAREGLPRSAVGQAPARVRGSLVLASNDLRLRPDLPLLANAKARIAFTENSFVLTNGSADVLGGQASVQGARQDDGGLRFDVQGTVSAEGLAHATELGALARAAAPFSGQTGYRLALGFANGQTEWQLDSDLVGLAADLPVPLRKSAQEAWPLRVRAAAPAGLAPAAGEAARDLLSVDLGAEGARVLQARWLRELAPGGTRVLSGGIGVFEAAPQPARGVAASINVRHLDVDAWQRLAESWGSDAGTGAQASAAAGAFDAGYAPSSLALQVQTLKFGGRQFNGVVAGLSRGQGAESALWRINVDARELHGYGEYHPAGVRGAQGAGRIHARLTRLALPQSEADAVGSLLEEAPPTRLPALDVAIDDLELRGKRLGRFEIVAHNRLLPGGAAGWQLERLGLTTPDARFSAYGEWVAPASPGARRRAVLDFELDVADGGELLARLGQAGVVRGAKGKLGGQISWLGSPLAIDYPSLAGRVNIAFDGGQFLRADPGIAKLLGVLSLQSLPRRLLLDFRDVFEQGFAFDSVSGDATLEQGVASTRNLRMRGVQAVVLMEGSADTVRETQDLQVWVVPEINAGAASLAVAVINPAVGLGSFLAQWLLRRPLALAGTREFHVTGPWAEPEVERIERGLGEAPPMLDTPAPVPPEPMPGQ